MDNIFETINEEELMVIDGGDLVGGLFGLAGYVGRRWCEFWGGVGEAAYDWSH